MQNSNRSAEFRFMLAVVSVSMIARAIVIWFTRPEFAGWFNHTYYYFVQVRGILVHGSMPFSDLPLVFYLYAAAAKILMLFGVPVESATVNSSRFAMSVIPALTAVPTFFLLQRMRRGKGLELIDKLLIAAAAFLPLNLVHMPELLQKNSFGIFLFACLLLVVFKSLEEFSYARGASIAAVLALIGASHFGSLAVSLLFLGSLALALIVTEGLTRRTFGAAASGTLAVLFAALLLFLIVPERLDRFVEFAGSNLRNSLAGRLFIEGDLLDRSLYLAGIAVPFALLVLSVKYLRSSRWRRDPDRVFVLANVFLAYLLVSPLVDTALIPRFLLFLPLPAIVIFSGMSRRSAGGILRMAPAIALLLLCGVMAFGEVMGTVMRNDSNRIARSELVRLRESGIVSSDDLVVTSYGANPACNWFLGSKSALITAVDGTDIDGRVRFFVLITETAAFDELPVDRDGDGQLSDVERYYASRRPIELPKEARSVFRGGSFELFELRSLPGNWKFDGQGRWMGYGESER